MKTASRSTARRTLTEKRAPKAETAGPVGGEPIDPRWAWHYRTLSHLRDRIIAAHQEHAAEVSTAPEMVGYESADNAREELDRDILWAELGAENNRLYEIDAALNRIRQGTYGICEANGEPIAPARLRVIPWTRYCHAAAEIAERRRHEGSLAT